MKIPISHILRNMVPLWISMLKLLKNSTTSRSLPSMTEKGSHFLYRVVKCGGSLKTHSFRWPAALSRENERKRLNFVSGCGGRPSMTESFRVHHHVLISCAEGVPSSDHEGACREQYLYTAPSTITTDAEDSAITVGGLDLTNPWALEERKSGGFDAMAKYSCDPCSDFVRSIMEMITVYSLTQTHDLEALLQCYLRLNAPIHHPTITLAFLTALTALDSDDIS